MRIRVLTLYASCLWAAMAATPVHAVDLNWSGFATLGYARSNSDYTYQRYIDKSGSFDRDSILAGQLDLALTPQWSATMQIKAAPAETKDSRWTAQAAWAFAAWRPDNDWLVRAGKMRVPLYLHSESLDVGVASDMARLPHEMYSIAPSNDFKGLSLTRSLNWRGHELSVEAYAGNMHTHVRLWLRDGLPPIQPAGPMYLDLTGELRGLVFSGRDEQLTWRLGVMSTRARDNSGRPFPVRFPRVELAPGIGYWKVDDAMPGPPIESTHSLHNSAITAGAEWQVDDSWRVAGEFVRMRQRDTELGSDSKAGYLAVFKRIGSITPYVMLARQRSSDGVLEWSRRLLGDRLPDAIPGAALANSAQRVAGESLYAFDQRSFATGLSYAASARSKLKVEWMRTRVGVTSSHFDTPPGRAGTTGLVVHTLSVNYSVAF